MSRRHRHLVISFPLVKGGLMAPATLAVINSDLTPFAQALIIALVSATIGALGMIASQWMNGQQQRELLELQRRTEEHVQDLKGVVGADQRRSDAQHSAED